jgi:hypothetical protein
MRGSESVRFSVQMTRRRRRGKAEPDISLDPTRTFREGRRS